MTTLMKTSTGYWTSSALAVILTDCLLNPNTYLQNLKFILSVGLLHIKIVQIIIFCSVKSIWNFLMKIHIPYFRINKWDVTYLSDMHRLQKYMPYVSPPLNAHDGCMYGNISHLVFSRVRVARSLAYCGVFCSAVVCPSWPLCCLSFIDLPFLLPPLLSSIFS